MRFTRLCALGLVLSLVSPVPVVAETLAPDYEMERLLLVAQEQLSRQNWPVVATALQSLRGLPTELPASVHYLTARLQLHDGDRSGARDSLIRYVNQAGREGEHYREALDLISSLEVAEPPTAAVTRIEPTVAIAGADRSLYLEQLRRLYLVEDNRAALLEHLNTLLANHAHVPSRVRDLTRPQGLEYRLTLGRPGELVVQETRHGSRGEADYQVSRLDVFGIDPHVQTDCDHSRRQCWVRHPVRPAEPWLVIDDDRQALAEVARALTLLLIDLQS